MSSNPNKYKFVALVNKELEPAVALNAIAHASIGLGAMISKENCDDMKLLDFTDKDGTVHPNISALSLIVLRGTSGNIRRLRKEAIAAEIKVVDFTTSMTGGTYLDQLDRTSNTAEDALEYSVALMFGEVDQLAPLTKKYSLYR